MGTGRTKDSAKPQTLRSGSRPTDEVGVRREALTSATRELLRARLPAGMPEADQEAALAHLTQLVDDAQGNLIELALALARSGHATSCPIGSFPAAPAESVEATGRIVRPEERVSYRIADVAERTGVSIASVRKHLGKNIGFRRVDGMVLLAIT